MKKQDNETINFGFWKKVKENADAEKRPILTLAPMADVTDEAFRRLIAKYSRMGEKGGGPDVMWTEFVSADGLCSPGRKVLLRDLAFSKKEKPIVAQLFTSHPDKMKEAAKLVAELGLSKLREKGQVIFVTPNLQILSFSGYTNFLGKICSVLEPSSAEPPRKMYPKVCLQSQFPSRHESATTKSR